MQFAVDLSGYMAVRPTSFALSRMSNFPKSDQHNPVSVVFVQRNSVPLLCGGLIPNADKKPLIWVLNELLFLFADVQKAVICHSTDAHFVNHIYQIAVPSTVS